MATPLEFARVSDLIPSMHVRYVVKLKILRRYRCSSSLDTLQLVLSDDKGDRIQATIGEGYVANVSSRLIEGRWIFIKYFDLVNAVGSFRLTLHDYKICWELETSCWKIGPLASGDDFGFVQFEDIIGGFRDPNFSVDLVGRLVSINDFDHSDPGDYGCQQLYLELENEA
ncbi:hypothetical protein ISN44_As10g007690 [Arabidopsis suecica]|uniref:Replication protein A 70 kDa DNA-binding subunit B/D first OB fold domain-containing protein n=1 Tax=Arabidopsis suecica TaxID=45249 RepID=A0A8T1ZTF0_ARASU|nr:hypothetical protein ISN44_As10g007690 [Arabidopsis suecica]